MCSVYLPPFRLWAIPIALSGHGFMTPSPLRTSWRLAGLEVITSSLGSEPLLVVLLGEMYCMFVLCVVHHRHDVLTVYKWSESAVYIESLVTPTKLAIEYSLALVWWTGKHRPVLHCTCTFTSIEHHSTHPHALCSTDHNNIMAYRIIGLVIDLQITKFDIIFLLCMQLMPVPLFPGSGKSSGGAYF